MAEERTFTQAEVDAAVEKRLAREREKYADYDALRDKAAQYDKAQEAAKSDLQKAQEQAAAYKAQLDAKTRELATAQARSKVSAATGVPEALLTGADEAACQAQADALLKWRGDAPAIPNHSTDHALGAKSPGGDGKSNGAAFATLLDGLFDK